MSKIKPRVSSALTEVRTVRSRALTGIERLDYLDKHGYPTVNGEDRDPEHDEILDALIQVVRLLDPYKKENTS